MMQISKTSKPILVSVEGVDGVGKTTLIKGLREKLRADGVESVVYKVPGEDNTGISKFTRFLFKQGWYVHGVCRFTPPIHLSMVRLETYKVEKQLKVSLAGKSVDVLIADRSAVSNYAYGESSAGTVREQLMHRFVDFLFGDAMLPKLSFYIHVEPEVIVSRIKGRGEAVSEAEAKRLGSLQKRYDNIFGRDGYGSRYRLLRDTNVTVIDGNRSREEVLSFAFAILKREIG